MVKEAVEVLVVGAGPVGLFCANELKRHGIRCRIIDQKAELSDKSKALGLHIRTLDVLQDTGLFHEVLKQGHKVQGVLFKSNDRELVRADFKGIEANHHFLIDLPQDKTERILYDHLQQQGIEVEWETALVNVSQTQSEVIASLTHHDGSQETIHTKWLIACDGAHSTVRHRCNMEFEGSEYHQNWWLADLLIDWEESDEYMSIFIGPKGPLACFPMGNKRFRLVLTALNHHEGDPSFADIVAAFNERSSNKAKLSNPVWITKFYIHHRQIEQYRRNRIFFAGDAAHIHSPMGGQGLNTGIQDVYNLVWKLALVEKGQAKDLLLDSYHLERYPVGKQVLQETDLMTRMILIENPLLIRLRNVMLSTLMSFKPIRKTLAAQIAELRISYEKSPIVKDLSHQARFKAGTFLTDFNLTNATSGEVKSLSEILQGTKHHLLLFTGIAGHSEASLLEMAKMIEHDFNDVIESHLILSHAVELPEKNAFHLWIDEEEIQEHLDLEKPTVILIRPDKYIGFSQSPAVHSVLSHYLQEIFLKHS
ncbi:FAD-dependent monooxygenase [Legionella impletisoli]|uniref:FAD-binding monooxygenase n=1 Tax=Legionella impletisoli TaxID=343510 RepID=A0A917JWL7_9GAMM|nr:FAD-dependent monooxygenase [Legionella impletisoli]GGI87446.1 FAD-binding monooxygenase [Legionella impletisoli]